MLLLSKQIQSVFIYSYESTDMYYINAKIKMLLYVL